MALIYADGEGPEVLPQKVVTVEGGKKPHSHKKRDVDVLSNRCVCRLWFLKARCSTCDKVRPLKRPRTGKGGRTVPAGVSGEVRPAHYVRTKQLEAIRYEKKKNDDAHIARSFQPHPMIAVRPIPGSWRNTKSAWSKRSASYERRPRRSTVARTTTTLSPGRTTTRTRSGIS